MGRKPLSNRAKSNRPLRVLLTDEERTELDAAAVSVGLPTSTWARDLLLSAARSAAGIATASRQASAKKTPPTKAK